MVIDICHFRCRCRRRCRRSSRSVLKYVVSFVIVVASVRRAGRSRGDVYYVTRVSCRGRRRFCFSIIIVVVVTTEVGVVTINFAVFDSSSSSPSKSTWSSDDLFFVFVVGVALETVVVVTQLRHDYVLVVNVILCFSLAVIVATCVRQAGRTCG